MLTVAEYLELPYHRVIQPDESGLWSANVLGLDGVCLEGESAEEAAHNLNVAMGLWIEHELALDHSIPEPWNAGDRSGDLRVRMPRSLHSRAATRARIEGVSLNYLVVTALAEYMERPAAGRGA
ncbi:MAG: type II toxin-antitoxin system HicB family antitoxin [Chloroflexi bacterium]|nr:type II toxin-antitoxin system HicB family antitoxin [Chloroflexota bacterium]